MRYKAPDNGPRPVAASGSADRPTSPPTDEGATPIQESERNWWQHVREFCERNFGLFLVFSAQSFGSVMSTAAKLLTSKDSPNQFHALHIIFVRMLATAILGSLYMWYKKVPNFPLGPRNMFPLLVLRGTAGFIGLFGLYYSLAYLEISDSTAITFLVPTWTAILCYVWLGEPYRIQEALSGLISLAGVLLIARPAFLFGSATVPEDEDPMMTMLMVDGAQDGLPVGSPSSSQRTIAVVCSIAGTFAAATAYSTIRVIGKQVHSLISVNYFAALSTIGSALILLVHPDLGFILPKGAMQWILLGIIGVAGFLLQFLLTEGLQREKGGRATNMTYFQMVLALIIERVIWGTTPALLSLVGSVLIIGAAIWLSLQKAKPNEVKERTAVVDEETKPDVADKRETGDRRQAPGARREKIDTMASLEIAAGLRRAAKEMHGIVVSAGLMDKTVKVRLGGQRWEQRVHKWFKEPRYKLVHDPRNSLRQGDVVAITPSWRESQHVRHVVKHIIAPYGGVGIDERPPIPTIEERAAELNAKRQKKAEARALRRRVDEAVQAAERLLLKARKALRRTQHSHGGVATG
ncbi:hypothetical protein F4859DRAFT_518199 [Xylaria cf. heliscus]|nr:hypothetical protein F4859DRAFT_518199 [Xylaria cf. heliscus]